MTAISNFCVASYEQISKIGGDDDVCFIVYVVNKLQGCTGIAGQC